MPADGTTFETLTSPNTSKLAALVARCESEAPHKMEPDRFMRANADRLAAWLQELSENAASDQPLPAHLAHLDGVSALDLSDAMDRLNAGARVLEREGIGAFHDYLRCSAELSRRAS